MSYVLQGDSLGLDEERMALEMWNDMQFLVGITKRFLNVYRFHRKPLLCRANVWLSNL
jgi:hypothetical protein